jgi:hypothetical protein
MLHDTPITVRIVSIEFPGLISIRIIIIFQAGPYQYFYNLILRNSKAMNSLKQLEEKWRQFISIENLIKPAFVPDIFYLKRMKICLCYEQMGRPRLNGKLVVMDFEYFKEAFQLNTERQWPLSSTCSCLKSFTMDTRRVPPAEISEHSPRGLYYSTVAWT